MSIFNKDFFKSIFDKKDNKVGEAVELENLLGDAPTEEIKTESPVVTPAPKKRPDSLLKIDELLKREREGKKPEYDNPILEDYYKRLSKQERRLDKGKMIEFSSPMSERYYLDGDIGQRATKENKLPNAETSGYTGLYTKPQLHKVGMGVDSKDVDVADIPSTAIAKVRYNPKTKNLYVTFTSSDKEYLYPNVPADAVRKFINAESKGRYANKRLPKYAVSASEAQYLANKYRGK